eukprot:4817004-Prymnesium_polylepis.1
MWSCCGAPCDGHRGRGSPNGETLGWYRRYCSPGPGGHITWATCDPVHGVGYLRSRPRRTLDRTRCLALHVDAMKNIRSARVHMGNTLRTVTASVCTLNHKYAHDATSMPTRMRMLT